MNAFGKASADGLIQGFSIYGLHGFRNLHLNSRRAASILIARNGMGKTTLLAALNVFLKTQFHRLLEVDFERIECTVRGDVIVLWKRDLESLKTFVTGQSFTQLVEMTKLSASELLDFMFSEYDLEVGAHAIRVSENYSALSSAFRYDVDIAKTNYDRLFKELCVTAGEIMQIRHVVRQRLGAIEVVYLPTYRRVELPLAERKGAETQSSRRRSPVKRLEFYQGGCTVRTFTLDFPIFRRGLLR